MRTSSSPWSERGTKSSCSPQTSSVGAVILAGRLGDVVDQPLQRGVPDADGRLAGLLDDHGQEGLRDRARERALLPRAGVARVDRIARASGTPPAGPPCRAGRGSSRTRRRAPRRSRGPDGRRRPAGRSRSPSSGPATIARSIRRVHEGDHVGGHLRGGVARRGLAGVAVPAGGDRVRMDPVGERREDGLEGTVGVGEAVQQDQRDAGRGRPARVGDGRPPGDSTACRVGTMVIRPVNAAAARIPGCADPPGSLRSLRRGSDNRSVTAMSCAREADPFGSSANELAA